MPLAIGDMYVQDRWRRMVEIDWRTVPGDRAESIVPLYMTPTVVKEYLMLSRKNIGTKERPPATAGGLSFLALGANRKHASCMWWISDPPSTVGKKRLLRYMYSDSH
jgi:hypothetical protein